MGTKMLGYEISGSRSTYKKDTMSEKRGSESKKIIQLGGKLYPPPKKFQSGSFTGQNRAKIGDFALTRSL